MSEMNSTKHTCPLCGSVKTGFYFEDRRRTYQHCAVCLLVFVPECFHLSAALEKAEYDLHENQTLTKGYRGFLERTLIPLHNRISTVFGQAAEGLDFGCGEGKALSHLAQERGLRMANYDLYYHPDESVLHKSYHFITMTEVLEHLAQPYNVLSKLVQQLKPGGMLAIMTKRVTDVAAFSTWHYKNDMTHICFYSESTFHWLAARLGLRLEIIEQDVVFFYKAQ
jgi:hypothetical protein